MNIYIYTSCVPSDVTVHFVFPGKHSALSRQLILRMLLNLLAVNHEQFCMQMTHKSKHNNAGLTKWLEILAGEDFPPKLLWSENTDLKFSASNGEETAEQREYRFNSRAKATPSTRDRGYSDQKHVQRQRQNTTITLQMKPMKSGTPPNADASRKKIK